MKLYPANVLHRVSVFFGCHGSQTDALRCAGGCSARGRRLFVLCSVRNGRRPRPLGRAAAVVKLRRLVVVPPKGFVVEVAAAFVEHPGRVSGAPGYLGPARQCNTLDSWLGGSDRGCLGHRLGDRPRAKVLFVLPLRFLLDPFPRPFQQLLLLLLRVTLVPHLAQLLCDILLVLHAILVRGARGDRVLEPYLTELAPVVLLGHPKLRHCGCPVVIYANSSGM
mmetsp:Transcript_17085/g.30543  ORF Transcript_17085/g.30543 Transcript_17085/m.30543 type:complete len:222 (+) Transcript_17085:410-1075(+)